MNGKERNSANRVSRVEEVSLTPCKDGSLTMWRPIPLLAYQAQISRDLIFLSRPPYQLRFSSLVPHPSCLATASTLPITFQSRAGRAKGLVSRPSQLCPCLLELTPSPALRNGHATRPLAVIQKKTLSGIGKDRDEAIPFWDQ